MSFLICVSRHPATAKWYDRRDSVYIEFCVADSKNVKINFEEAKFVFRRVMTSVSGGLKEKFG